MAYLVMYGINITKKTQNIYFRGLEVNLTTIYWSRNERLDLTQNELKKIGISVLKLIFGQTKGKPCFYVISERVRPINKDINHGQHDVTNFQCTCNSVYIS